MTEFDLIRSISSRFQVPEGLTGIGDDCAVIPGASEDTLVTTDLLAEGVHFLVDCISPFDLGYKSAAVNISDIAAMGGLPKYAFLSLALPKEYTAPGADCGWLTAFMDGFTACCRRYGVTLLGGDTSASSGGIFINVTLMGTCPHGTALMRSSARPGDLICVTGTLGDSAAGLRLIKEADADTDAAFLLRRHCHPEPRVAEGLALRQCPGIHAMMDLSDGLASDLPHILEASGKCDFSQHSEATKKRDLPHSFGASSDDVDNIGKGLSESKLTKALGATIDVRSLPLSAELRSLCSARGWDPIDLAICGGEDYELLFTMAPGTLPPIPCTVIGTITPSPKLLWLGGRDHYDGFRHF